MPTINNITARLREKGITLAALADELGVKISAVSCVASGKAKSYNVQTAIAKHLDTTVEDLWPGQIRLRRNRAQIEANETNQHEAREFEGKERRSDAIRYLLARHPDQMRRGFSIHTNYGDFHIDADEAEPFVKLVEKVLGKRLAKQEKIEQMGK